MPIPFDSPLTLDQLLAPLTYEQTLDLIFTTAAKMGLPATQWQAGGVAREWCAVWASVLARQDDAGNFIGYNGQAATIARAGFLDTCALLPDNRWMDLLGVNVFDEARLPAQTATGIVTVFNTSHSSYGPFPAGTFGFTSTANGVTYKNKDTFSIPPATTLLPGIVNVTVIATVEGAAGSTPAGTITQFVSPPGPGVTCTNTDALIGVDAESNLAYAARCRAKWGAISPNGASKAAEYAALSATYNNSGVMTPCGVNRVRIETGTNGNVTVFIAAPDGQPLSGPRFDAVSDNVKKIAECLTSAYTTVNALDKTNSYQRTR